MKLKHIESCLSSVTREFPDPKIRLEQYPTSAELTASIVSLALREQDIGPGRTVLDLGCGTGMLAMGCAIVDCDAIFGIDCDVDALKVAVANSKKLNVHVEFLLAKVNDSGFVQKNNHNHQGASQGRGGKRKAGRSGGRTSRGSQSQHVTITTLDPNAPDFLPLVDKCVDTVVTNPPFGTKHNVGMDVRFLKAGTRLAKRAVYSFHKTSTREYMLKMISGWGFTGRVVAELKFDIPATYKFHSKASVDIAVDLIRVLVAVDDDCTEEDEEEEGNEEEEGDGTDCDDEVEGEVY